MNAILKDGTTVACESEPFDSGADGAAYWSQDGRWLVKIYHKPETWRAASLEAMLTRFNAVKGDPYWAELLCWPTGIVTSPGLGVIVPRAAPGLKKLAHYIIPQWLRYHPEDIGTWRGRLRIAISICRALRRLHFTGLCHSDLSENNVLANVNDGRTYVIDCDGLVVPGLDIARPVVAGTPGMMAPELVSGLAEPSVDTDKHSLAVTIYQLLLLRHPLHGRKVHDPKNGDRDDLLRHGERALFIEHPTDTTNRPEVMTWPMNVMGAGAERLFQKAFIDGLHKPGLRPSPADWERVLVPLWDTLVNCLNPNCVLKVFPFPDINKQTASITCPWCKQRFGGFTLPVLRWLTPQPSQQGLYRPDGTRLVGWPGVSVHQWHTEVNTLPGPSINQRPLATFQRLQDVAGNTRWVLLNQEVPYMEVADPGSTWRRVRVNEAAELRAGRKLKFGPTGFYRDASVELITLQ